MDNWLVPQRVFAVTAYIECKSIVNVQRMFRREYNIERHGRIPSRNTILRWVEKWQTAGTICNKFVGPSRTVRTAENIAMIRNAVQKSPTRSAVRQAAALGISSRTFRRIVHNDLNFHPYKIQIVHHITHADTNARLDFCRQFITVLNENPNVLSKLIMSDEAHFHLSGYVNKQNFRYWSAEQPMQMHEQPLHSQKVTVWCGVSSFGIIGPYFFEEDSKTVTINSNRYLTMLDTFVMPQLRQFPGYLWFQQDGATSHTARSVLNFLRDNFPDRLISRFGDFSWPSRSPDLTAPDYFLWGYLKSKVYIAKPRTIVELKHQIVEEIRNIDVSLLQRVMQNFRKRLDECVINNGEHLKSVIFQ